MNTEKSHTLALHCIDSFPHAKGKEDVARVQTQVEVRSGHPTVARMP